MSFQKTVAMVFFIILIIFLVIIGVALYDAKYKNPIYPPKISQCPDYWTLDNENYCVNTQGLGNSSCDKRIMTSKYTTSCDKKKFATDCELSWDGITNVGLDCINPK